VRAARESVNHTMSSAREAGEWARKAFSEATTQATRLGRAAREVATTGRNASLAH
jgi:hypothetical protein